MKTMSSRKTDKRCMVGILMMNANRSIQSSDEGERWGRLISRTIDECVQKLVDQVLTTNEMK